MATVRCRPSLAPQTGVVDARAVPPIGAGDKLHIRRASGHSETKAAAAYIDRYFQRFPAVQRFIDETIERAEREGRVTTLLGRRRNIPELRSSNRQRKLLGERLAVNTVIQGTAADIIKLAMINCHRALADAGFATRLILQIHDELLFEGPEAEAEAVGELARREMIAAFDLDPPLAVEIGIGPDWLSAK